MFLIPLGLGSKLPIKPLGCILLCLIIAIFSISQFRSVGQFEEIASKRSLERRAEPLVQLFAELCAVKLNDPAACEHVVAQLVDQITKRHPEMKERLEPLKGRKPASESKLKSDLGFSAIMKLTKKTAALSEEFAKIARDPAKVQDQVILGLPHFAQFAQISRELEADQETLARKHGLATARNLTPATLLKAQLIHAGWLHLIGNLLVLVLVGIYLEARTGPGQLLAVFFLTGLAGIGGHVYFFSDPGQPCLGASGGVAGVMGAFLAFFWAQPMKVWVSYFFFVNRRVFIPSFWVLGALFIANDVTSSLTGGGNVAHQAHLIGLVAGFGIGLVFKKIWPLDEEVLFEEEQYLMGQLDSVKSPLARRALSKRILTWNRNNLRAMSTFVSASFETSAIDKELHETVTSYVAVSMKRKSVSSALEMLQTIPVAHALAPYIDRVSLKSRFELANAALSKNDAVTAIRLYDSVLRKFKRADLRDQILKSVEQINMAMRGHEEVLRILQELNLTSELKTRLSA